VVVTGHRMPGQSGLELVELLRQTNYAGRIAVQSSAVTRELAERYRGFGVESIVVKAARADELLNAVEGSTRR
jgi:DNA-binding NarL/FixJ family response regulator